MESVLANPMMGVSLLPVWGLVGLFQYLRRFTGKRHFHTWTSGWLFYALFITLGFVPESAIGSQWLSIAKNWCVATGALLILWGSFQFINVPAKQRLIAMMVVFNLMWSCAIADKRLGEVWGNFPAFAFLALASGFTAFCFFSRRTSQGQRGAALLTLAFGLWSLFLLCSPFLNGSETLMYSGLTASSGLQLFIAISMMVLVLEETRGRLHGAVLGFTREVEKSDRFRAEAEIAAESYQVLFESSKDAVMIVAEEDLEILDLNPAARKLLELKEQSAGLSLKTYCSLANQKQTDTKTFLAALPKNPEVDLTLHEGTKVRARARSQSIRHKSRKAQQIIFRDVAERANLGRQIRSGKMSALGQVISGVAHELNNPLAAIKGYTDLLLLTSQLNAQTRAALLKVSQESNRAARLVRDLVAFARPEPPRIEPLNVNDLIQNFAEQRRADLEGKGIALELELGADTALALASGEQIQQVVAHLLNNAAEALDEVEEGRAILISTKTVEARIEIRVEDSGPGIEPDVLPRIFEPFFTTKPVGTGTGLGLSVAYSIILQHRGNISYQPSILGGASFVVTLPAAFNALQPKPNIETPDFRPRSGAVSTARLLVVDDEPSVGALLNDMLTLLGHQVTTEASPLEALARIKTQEFDAILSDFRMPGMNGGELYQQAVAFNASYAQRFLFLTGDMMDAQTNDFFRSKEVRFLLKPFQLCALQSALAEILEQNPPRQAATA